MRANYVWTVQTIWQDDCVLWDDVRIFSSRKKAYAAWLEEVRYLQESQVVTKSMKIRFDNEGPEGKPVEACILNRDVNFYVSESDKGCFWSLNTDFHTSASTELMRRDIE